MRTLKILQYNTKKSRKVMDPMLADKRFRKIDVLAIQEPWQDTTAVRTVNPATSPFHSIYPSEHGGACLFINKNLDLNSWSTTIHSPDFCTVHLQIDRIIFNIHNLYSRPPAAYNSTATNSPIYLLDNALQVPGEHIVLGDFNFHHPLWNHISDPTHHSMANDLLDITTTKGLGLLTETGHLRGYRVHRDPR